MRILLMVLRLFYIAPGYMIGCVRRSKNGDRNETFQYVKRFVERINKAGRVDIEVHGLENLPKEDGFVMFPNHQGLFDILVFLQSCPKPFSFVFKQEVKNIILLKQTIMALHAIPIDRKDLRQSMQVIKEMTSRVSEGENFLIFAEGTRSRKGNETLPFKGGSFKSAVKAKAPIVPCALIDSYKPFDESSIKRTTVKVFYLEPIGYEQYKDLSTTEIAERVKGIIDKTLEENT